MGVVYLFKLFSQKYPNAILKIPKRQVLKSVHPSDIDVLALDLNAIFHPCVHKVIEREQDRLGRYQKHSEIVPIDHKLFFKEICFQIETLRRVVNPKKQILLMIDGVASLSKQYQQRQRRFRSAVEKSVEAQKWFDTNAISCGTEFMNNLSRYIHVFIQKQMKQHKEWAQLEIIFSNEKVEGEGEQKIIRFIDEQNRSQKVKTNKTKNQSETQNVNQIHTQNEIINENNDKQSKTQNLNLIQTQNEDKDALTNKKSYVIFSPDADVLLLSMSLGIENVFVLRENAFQYVDKSQYFLVNIDILKHEIIHQNLANLVGEQTSENVSIFLTEQVMQRINDDLVFLFSLFGNDFLPSTVSMQLGNGGLDNLYTCYFKHHTINEFVVTHTVKNRKMKQVKLNQRLIIKILTSLVEFEDVFLNGLISKFDFDDMHDYKQDWYMRKLNISKEEDISVLCHEYLKAMVFVINYYQIKLPDWNWQYPYKYAPFLKDLIKIFSNPTFDINKISFIQNKPLTPLQQLISVLPPQSLDLLPTTFSNVLKMTSHNQTALKALNSLNNAKETTETTQTNFINHNLKQNFDNQNFMYLRDFYPSEILFDKEDKHADYESVVLIPFADIRVVLKLYKQNQHELSQQENKREKRGKSYFYKTQSPTNDLSITQF